MISGVSCSELPIHSARFRLSTSTPNGTYCTLNAENILPPVSSATEMCRERNGESRGGDFLLVFPRDDHDVEFGA